MFTLCQDLAQKLKEQLEASRKLREEQKANPAGSTSEEGNDGNVVVLTRTGRDGMVRPLDDSQHPRMQGKGRKKRKEKVQLVTDIMYDSEHCYFIFIHFQHLQIVL